MRRLLLRRLIGGPRLLVVDFNNAPAILEQSMAPALKQQEQRSSAPRPQLTFQEGA